MDDPTDVGQEGYDWSPEEVAESKALALHTGKITGARWDALVVEVEELRAALLRAYVLLKDERDSWAEDRHREVSQAVEDICPLLNLPTADDMKGILT